MNLFKSILGGGAVARAECESLHFKISRQFLNLRMRVDYIILISIVAAREVNVSSLSLYWNGECGQCLMSIFDLEVNATDIRLENFLPVFSGQCSNCTIELAEKIRFDGMTADDKARLKLIIQILLICLLCHCSGLITQFLTFIGSILTIDHHAKSSISLKKLREYQVALPYESREKRFEFSETDTLSAVNVPG